MEDQTQQDQQNQAPQLTGEPPATGAEPSAPDAEPATAPADTDNSTPQEQPEDGESVAQMVAAQLARARNAIQHMEQGVAREIHAALGEIESLLGMK